MEFRPGEINIFVSDKNRSLAFYRDILGFKVLGEDRGAVHLQCGTQNFLLLPFAGPRAETPAYGAHPCVSFDLEVDEIAAAYDYCRDAGVAFERELEVGGDNFFIRDPDGNVIEVIG
jgi:catechol 2,3-dioxygenase-like lactoylglutathione lyase family enzyme